MRRRLGRLENPNSRRAIEAAIHNATTLGRLARNRLRSDRARDFVAPPVGSSAALAGAAGRPSAGRSQNRPSAAPGPPAAQSPPIVSREQQRTTQFGTPPAGPDFGASDPPPSGASVASPELRFCYEFPMDLHDFAFPLGRRGPLCVRLSTAKCWCLLAAIFCIFMEIFLCGWRPSLLFR